MMSNGYRTESLRQSTGPSSCDDESLLTRQTDQVTDVSPVPFANRLSRILLALIVVAFLFTLSPDAQADEAQDDYNLAVNLYRQNRWKQAADQFRRFIKTYEKHEKAPLARLYLGLTLVNLEDYKTARDELLKFIDENRQNPNISQARYRIGECSYLLDQLPTARGELESFIQDFPKDPMCEHALPYLGDIQLRLKGPETALKTFDRAIEQFPKGKLIDDARFGRARSLESLKRYDDAIAQYRELAVQKNGPRAADAQFHIGASYFERKQYAEAIAAYAVIPKEFPQSPLVPAAQLNTGYALYQSGNFDDAARQFELAAKDKSQSLTARYWQGRSLKSLGDYTKAAEVLKAAALASDGQSLAEAILFEQGLCERYLQHPAEARAFFDQVLTRFPKGDLADDSLHALIEMSIEAGDLAVANQLLARFQQDFPKSGLRWHVEMLNGRLELASAGQKLRDKSPVEEINAIYDSAARRFENVMKESSLAKTRGQARYYLALSRQLQGDHATALEVIAPLVEQATADGGKPEFADALVLQADSFLQLKNYEASAAATGKYLSLFPKGRLTARALSLQALAADNVKDSTAVGTAVERLTKEFSGLPVTLVTVQQLAETAEAREDWPAAEKMYQSLIVLQKEPEKKAYAVRGLALSQYWQSQFAAAAASFGKVIGDYPDHTIVPECLYYQGDSLKKADQPDQAIAIFQKLFDTFPADKTAEPKAELSPPLEYPYKAGLQIARILNKANKVVEADAAYEALLKRFPQPLELDKRLDEWAIVNYQHQRFDQADAIWRRLVAETPQSPLVNTARLSLAESDLIANKLDEAKVVFEELAASDKSSDEVKEQSLYQLVVLAVDRQQWPDVLMISNRLVTQFPKTKHRYYVAYSQAEAYLAATKPIEADQAAARERLQSLQKEAANDEVNSALWFDRVWVLLAELNFREKKYPEVLAVAEDLKRRNSKSQFAHQVEEVVARSYKQQAKFDDARSAFERVLADPAAARTETAAKSQFMIGETWFLQENWSAASLAYQRVYSIYKFPEWQSAALLMSAKCDEKQNEWKQAVESYKLLLKDFPDSTVAGEAKTRLEAAQKKVGG